MIRLHVHLASWVHFYFFVSDHFQLIITEFNILLLNMKCLCFLSTINSHTTIHWLPSHHPKKTIYYNKIPEINRKPALKSDIRCHYVTNIKAVDTTVLDEITQERNKLRRSFDQEKLANEQLKAENARMRLLCESYRVEKDRLNHELFTLKSLEL